MERDKLMQKARANKCIADSIGFQDNRATRQRDLAAFLDFMHPEMSEERKAKLIRETE